MTDVMTTKKPKRQKAPPPFLVELIDQLLATVQNKDAESILGEFELSVLLHLLNAGKHAVPPVGLHSIEHKNAFDVLLQALQGRPQKRL